MKHIINIITLTLLTVFFTACQSPINLTKNPNALYQKSLQHTKVMSLIHNNSTQAIFNITNLNSLNKIKYDNEYQNFLVGIYILDDLEDNTKQYLNNPNYKLTLNQKNYVKAKILTDEYEIYNNIPMKNPWARYYIISFTKEKQNNLNIKYSFKNKSFVEVLFIQD